jgi:putative transposase
VLVDQNGLPLAVVIDGANRHDVKLLEATLDNLILEPRTTTPQPHLCADAGYEGKSARQQVEDHGYIPHIRSRGEDKQKKQEGKRPRRWVVEALFSWLNRFRKLLVRFEKKARNYLGLLHFACGLIVWRRIIPIHAR